MTKDKRIVLMCVNCKKNLIKNIIAFNLLGKGVMFCSTKCYDEYINKKENIKIKYYIKGRK